MAENLTEIRVELYKAFNKAIKNADFTHDPLSYPKQASAAALSLQAAAQTAEAIVKVEQELQQRGDAKPNLRRTESAAP